MMLNISVKEDVVGHNLVKLIMRSIENVEVKANHPVTCLNPTEWFRPAHVEISQNNSLNRPHDISVHVRSEDSCWFNLEDCEIRFLSK